MKRLSFKREPAAWIGFLASVLTAVGQAAAGEVEWSAALPIVVALAVRFFVTPDVENAGL